uniref:Uncharacterized protein n=1 Tax=Solanum tuberosum TaxID=4113 RepID=M1DFX2_SOLTU
MKFFLEIDLKRRSAFRRSGRSTTSQGETTKATTAMAFRKSSYFSYKDYTDVVSADLSHVGPITRRKFKNSGLDGYEYFTSLEAMKNNNSHTMVVSATPRGNLVSVFFGEFSQIGSNFGESEIQWILQLQ